ncbi:ribosomal RNA small subunit methyltransferase E [Lentilactobacillus kosonis]|uniref:Ribosomal RNA small subunit methyltransferase E n=1 Tax=Lentilactobacillus kosonis TaxID=2810561 RepID=A0A401FL41_9LACO|nr:ribosomal RNA small subunit methyltransferase E [Lentilactobacillus kosonis]
MQHYFIDSSLPDDHNIELPADVAKHFVRVLRSDVGEQVELVLNDHRVYLAELSQIKEQRAICHIIRDLNHNVELPVKISLICGLPKQSKPEIIVQKATELGVSEIVFTEMQRSVVNWNDKAPKKLVGSKKSLRVLLNNRIGI